ncbi:hypothetical protein GCM10007933_22010 [Zoogloea oryzae]|uniref:Zinc finger Ogr/Delta-type domain-containing protein n=1 Tax=Zoogloea oryzae TaxID=310767 RepID=A0ABQ6FDR8_9RHOO|nr:ogr/Delta-like zinc finger family protein [Zoogloea oryzae]GLT22741.1 hypothetical protein GCM10007933_22010 [Zoogloea oryzae]
MSIDCEQQPSLRLRCPACNGPARVRNSQDISPSTRQLYMQCTNTRCLCIFESIAETTKVFAPSMLPESEQNPQMRAMHKGKRFAAKAKDGAHALSTGPEESAT